MSFQNSDLFLFLPLYAVVFKIYCYLKIFVFIIFYINLNCITNNCNHYKKKVL